MTVQEALAFLHEARLDDAIGTELEAMEGDITWEGLAQVGECCGFRFRPEELQRAHALDWGMRWARYQR